MNEGATENTEEGEYVEYSDYRNQEYEYGEYGYGYNDTMHPQQVYTGVSNGAVYYDQPPPHHYMRNFSQGQENFPPQGAAYVDDGSNQYIPFHGQQPRFYGPPPPQQQYYNSYQPGQYHNRGRGRGVGRGFTRGRGRGNRYGGDQYYGFENSYVVPCYGGYDKMEGEQQLEQQPNTVDGTKPKQFSYQGNRYRHDKDNRKRNFNNSDNGKDNHSGGPNRNYKSYSLLRSQHNEAQSDYQAAPGDDQPSNTNSVESEDYYKKRYDEKEDDEYSYVEKAQNGENVPSSRGRGYRSQRNVRERDSGYSSKSYRNDSGYKHIRGRGGYSNSKKTNNSIQYSQEMSRDSGNIKRIADKNKESKEEQSMTVLKGKGERTLSKTKTSKDSPRSSDETSKDRSAQKRKDLEDKVKIDTKARLRSSQNNRGRKFHFKGDQDDETQRGLLIEQLSSNSYECMVCCEVVRRDAAIWNCNNCYHAFHLRCIKKWARSPTAAVEGGQTGWRCPACQNVTPQVPNQYRCFCGKQRDPENNRYDTPHSCGEVCRRKRDGACPHLCNTLCHPGPCPVCESTITKSCNCGRFKMTVKCGQAPAIQCQEVCGKTRNCGRHDCKQVCHEGACKPCDEKIDQVCYCEEGRRDVVCGSSDSFSSSYSCGNVCKRKLDCGNHSCEKTCHPGVCDSCELSPESVQYCPCLKTPLSEITPPGEGRMSCTDPIPTCDKLCDKELVCGPADSPHKCMGVCHTGDCGTCCENTEIHCRCGALTNMVPCKELGNYTGANQFICDKRCNKKRDCGRHRCTQLCCVDEEHKCDMICGRKLTCNLHRCEELCHRGNCRSCWNVSFDELRCHCGNEVLYPPVACGANPPECRKTCTRMHQCGHDVLHPCHSEEKCPPCTQLTEKWCLGKHERRRNIPCHITDIPCGMKCNKPLPCGQHKCQQTCHKGECLAEGEKCDQPCTKLRDTCAHICRAPCHQGGPCPALSCRAEVTLKCECGSRSEKGICQVGQDEKSTQDYQRLATSMLAMRMSDARDGQSVDISSIMGGKDAGNKPRRLECTPECAIKERNRRLALALEIKNPDVSGKLGSPTYTEFLKDYAKKSGSFVASIEKALSDLVQAAQSSVKKSRSHAFQSMNRAQRQVVHELAEFYGCTTQSYDEEPKKNVVATAYKDKCFKPSVTLTVLVHREMHPKAPVPIPHRSSEEKIRSNVQAAKQSTTVLGSSGTAWNSKTTKPLNSWTTLKSSKSNTNNSSSSSPPLLRASQSETRLGGTTRSAWGQSSSATGLGEVRSVWGSSGVTPSQSATGRSFWGQSSSAAKKEEKKPEKKAEPVIDYFEMTD